VRRGASFWVRRGHPAAAGTTPRSTVALPAKPVLPKTIAYLYDPGVIGALKGPTKHTLDGYRTTSAE
jgi:hypothetical protein